ncbi:hypothetical protein EJ08DRAFT_458672 [Tothia fuscella]|uniref:Transmembrane protein n=1 Tax=Tothia fuscella TaxID=1048955 RepID=A0A9P4TUX8_9PEZI|nr:hypothetical protein EJ08DRAFT_458672 [Tothia fuscella]
MGGSFQWMLPVAELVGLDLGLLGTGWDGVGLVQGMAVLRKSLLVKLLLCGSEGDGSELGFKCGCYWIVDFLFCVLVSSFPLSLRCCVLVVLFSGSLVVVGDGWWLVVVVLVMVGGCGCWWQLCLQEVVEGCWQVVFVRGG